MKAIFGLVISAVSSRQNPQISLPRNSHASGNLKSNARTNGKTIREPICYVKEKAGKAAL
jgi:hypothetical protein